MTLSEIENEYDFKYSALYKQLEKDRMLDVGEYGPNWYSTVFPKLKENPTLLLHSYDFELLNINSILEEINDFSDPDDYRQINPAFRFVPFAKNGAGDHYCFLLNEQNGDDIPIVFVWHDCNEVNYLAKNLQDYIFRALLTDMSEQDTYNNVSDKEFRENIESVLKTHTRYLTERQTGILRNIFSREIIDYEIEFPNGRKEKHRGLLTDKELEEILLQIIPFEKLNQSFEYSLPEPIKEVTEENKRRVGTLTIRIQPIPEKNDKIYNNLKELNWRQSKTENVDYLEFYRKQSVIFGIPSIERIDETFKNKLLVLKAISKNPVQIMFKDEETKIVYNL
jgi:hypothetical protein